MTTMKAVRIHQFGGSDVLRIDEIPIPSPQRGEILVKAHAASVNPVDYKIRAGRYPAVRADKLPYVLGRDVSGEVAACGPGVAGFAQGETVYGAPAIERGAYAEYVILREAEAARKPSPLDHVGAAAVPLAGLTAWQGLFRHGGVKAGQRVLIHAGSGGVGHFAIQFAKAKGAYVITTASQAHLQFVRDLGADEAIDYKKRPFEDALRNVDMVFDLIGGQTQQRSWVVLKRGGILVSTLTAPDQESAAAHGVRALRYTVAESGSDLAEIGALIEAGKVTPKVTLTFPLDEAPAAQEAVEAGHTEGKVALVIAG